MNNYIFTSESVSEGHPDKVCDQISDAVLDAYLKKDPNSRVACETLIKNNLVVIAGEITSEGNPDLEKIVRNVINEIGYNDDKLGFNGNTCEFVNHITKQSPDIAQGVNEGEGENLDQGAGDQGLMFGFACNETKNLMPAPIDLSHQLVKKQSEVRKSGKLPWLRPDAKSQVSVVYDKDRKNTFTSNNQRRYTIHPELLDKSGNITDEELLTVRFSNDSDTTVEKGTTPD